MGSEMCIRDRLIADVFIFLPKPKVPCVTPLLLASRVVFERVALAAATTAAADARAILSRTILNNRV